MIPLFPRFKKLRLLDRREIEKITRQYAPYSDFNFVSLYCWNTDKNTEISKLNANFIIKMKDYSEEKNLYSFLGNSKTKKITDILCKKMDKELCSIKLIPEINFTKDKKILLRFKEDRDQFDYVYDLLSLSNLSGSSYGKKRNLCKKFENQDKVLVGIVDLKNRNIQKQILKLFDIWKLKKSKKEDGHDHEFIAIKRCFDLAKLDELVTLGLYLDSMLIGFSINNILPNKYAYTVFEKVNNNYRGASEYFFKKKAEILYSKGCRLLNYAQDLGIPGLRKAKESWRPVKYLKKYIIKN
jgi:uncharacterized protein